MKAMDKNFFNNTVMLYILKISSILFPLITFPYLTRILGKEYYSILVFVNSFVAYFVLFIDFGFILSSTKDIAINKENKSRVETILSSTILAKLTFVMLSLIIAGVLIVLIPSLRNNWLFTILSLLTICISAFMPDFFFRGIEKMTAITVRYIGIRTIYTIALFIFIKKPTDLIYVPIINIIGEVIAIIITWLYIFFKLKYRFVIPTIKDILEQIKKSLVYFYSRIATTVNNNTNTFILGLYYPTNVALYGVANTIITSIKGLYGPIADSLYPYMLRYKNFKMIKRILLIFMPLVLLGCIILFVFAPFFINLISGSEYKDAVSILRWMIPVLLFSLPVYILGFPTMGPLGLDKQANTSVIYSSILHVVGLSLLAITKSITMQSVAILTSITEFLLLCLRVFYICNFGGYTMKVKNRIKNIITRIFYLSFFILFQVLRIDTNKLFFISYSAKKYACNPKAFTEYLIQNYPQKYKLVWLLENPPENLPKDIIIVKPKTIKFMYHYYTSKIILNNSRMMTGVSKRKNQIYIQTWHAPLSIKEIEKDAESFLGKSYVNQAKRDSKMIDLLLSGSKANTKLFRSSFWYDGQIAEIGIPRSDSLFSTSEEEKKKIRNKLGVQQDEKLLLYAPTFRNNTPIETYLLDDKKIIEAFRNKYGGKWRILYRLHPNMLKFKDDLVLSDSAINVTAYQDIQDLLLTVDFLITDFSSSVFEAILLKLPCILYLNDYQQYVSQERGLYYTPQELPFLHADNSEDLVDAINSFDKESYAKGANEFLTMIGNVENGTSCEKLYDIIEKYRKDNKRRNNVK